jgi:hypothetical protein
MFDLRPVRLSLRGKEIRFIDAVEHALSSRRYLNKLHAPIVIAYGTLEAPESERQSGLCSGCGSARYLLVAGNYNHFEIAETLASPAFRSGGFAANESNG